MRLSIETEAIVGHAKTGDSICVSGVCLTVAAISGSRLDFDVVAETLEKTTLGQLQVEKLVNLEPALRAGDRLDGHFVQGHVDGTAKVEHVNTSEVEQVLWLRPDHHLLSYIIPKGSVAVDGVSLTVAALKNSAFSVALIPTTLQRTTLGMLRVGDRVNIESDVMVRTVVHYLQQVRASEAFQDRNFGPRCDKAEPEPPPMELRTSISGSSRGAS